MIDFHCHLDLYPDPKSVAQRCSLHNVRVLSVTNTPSAWRETSSLANEGSWTALGLHPQLAHERKRELGLFDDLLTETRFVGEIGLDGGPEYRRYSEEQIAVFDHILQSCAGSGGRIMSIHSRHAATPVLDKLEACPGAGTPVLHWFSGGIRELRRAIDLGCWFSVGPAMLKGERGKQRLRLMPHDKILTETDGPFGRAGQRALLPWDVSLAVDVLSDTWNSDKDETQKLLNDNLYRLLRTI